VLALVLGGGNALGAYHGGVIEALEVAGVEPGWVAGSSIGSVMAALVAGNPPGRRAGAAREFWRRGASLDGVASWVPESWRKPIHAVSALQARALGRPSFYHLRLSQLLGVETNPGLYDATPMRRTLEGLIDLDLMNAGPVRLSVMTVDLESGLETAFDTARERLTLDHIMASTALIPDFPAVEIGGRAYVDGGLASNVPADLVLQEPHEVPLSCFTVDPLPRAAPRPHRLGDASQRQTDLIFACQTERTLRAMRQLWQARDGNAPDAVYRLNYPAQPGETALKGFDFSQSSLDRRWQQGRSGMDAALGLWRSQPPTAPGLAVHDPVPEPAYA